MSDAGPSIERDPPEAERGFGRHRGRLARAVALVGALVFVLAGRSLVLPHIPQQHDVELRLEGAADVLGVDVRWSAAGTSEDIATTSLRFPTGGAPSSIRSQVRLPDGDYDVAIAVERATGVDSTRRRITLDDTDRVTIPLR